MKIVLLIALFNFFYCSSLKAAGEYYYPNSKELSSLNLEIEKAEKLMEEKKYPEAQKTLNEIEKSYPQHVKMMKVNLLRAEIIKLSKGCQDALLHYQKVVKARTTKYQKKFLHEMISEAKKKIAECEKK